MADLRWSDSSLIDITGPVEVETPQAQARPPDSSTTTATTASKDNNDDITLSLDTASETGGDSTLEIIDLSSGSPSRPSSPSTSLLLSPSRVRKRKRKRRQTRESLDTDATINLVSDAEPEPVAVAEADPEATLSFVADAETDSSPLKRQRTLMLPSREPGPAPDRIRALVDSETHAAELRFLCSVLGVDTESEGEDRLVAVRDALVAANWDQGSAFEQLRPTSRVAGAEPAAACLICLDDLDGESLYFALDTCTHLFHHACLAQHIVFKLEALAFPVCCPMPDCSAELAPSDVENHLEPDQWAAYCSQSFAHALRAPSFVHCPTPDCPFAAEMDLPPLASGSGPDAGSYVELACPACEQTSCARCQRPAHAGMTCGAAKAAALESQLESSIAGLGMRQCPSCRVWIEKVDGCDKIRCLCGAKWCFVCLTPNATCSCTSRAHGFHPASAVVTNFGRSTASEAAGASSVARRLQRQASLLRRAT
ncbi:IBR1/IBR2 fusion protein [Thecamonas trahens ATCC 50062]|uniref:IBR1/IBR2 fusion protein n=1 Tax=Thecamonas trahens ATCC 50062 TaxID=461836 RepID=A0A0L0DI82_THETB|nr:IBR1/IBR2 fusion protein [Thecamonas trahens ATCC 50062]KNC51018.1 IBR1/IBR2 fusion protein [Thecamonas trahens ATCC 50062]|eukprot:XP_013756485.1 IBR1/IBR2 fusion protein [Thecamonas trahens ATCC 50062]